MAEISTSLDWTHVQQELESTVRGLGKYSADMLQVSKNITVMVQELSKEEIQCRRLGRQTLRHRELLSQTNQQIQQLEQMITFATLLG
jgi:hypothetical protein